MFLWYLGVTAEVFMIALLGNVPTSSSWLHRVRGTIAFPFEETKMWLKNCASRTTGVLATAHLRKNNS